VTEAALPPVGTPLAAEAATLHRDLLHLIHTTIRYVTDDLDRFAMNRAVARIRELSNALEDFAPTTPTAASVLRHGLEVLVQLVAPMMPHLAEELWEELGHTQLVCETPWPVASAAFLTAATVTIAVQVNGKLRGTLDLPPGIPRAEVEAAALALANVARHLEGKTPRKVMVIPDKLVNVVA
jgi:leucyl-tRNA synthetase